MIEKLILRDFKSHTNSEIAFYRGLNIFLGEVGAGKTSIFEALSFALFGRYAGSINQSGLIRRGAKQAEISLTFSTRSGRYKIDRIVYPKKTQQAKMWAFDGEWKLAVEGAASVAKSVEEILNVDTSTFLAAIYASQGEIKEMLETQAGKRRERLDKLLGIDMYENIWKTLGDARHVVLTELTQAQDKSSGVTVLEKQFENLMSKIKRSEEELEQLMNSLEELDKTLPPTEQRRDQLDILQQSLTTVRIQIKSKLAETEKLTEVLNSLRKREEKAEEAEKVFEKNKKFIEQEKTVEKAKRHVETALEKKRTLKTLLHRGETNLSQALQARSKLVIQLQGLEILKKELEAYEKKRKTLPIVREKQDVLRKELETLNGQLIKALTEIENQKKKVNRVSELGECPTCFQTVPEEHKERIRDETHEIITKLTTDHSILKESRVHVEMQFQKLQEQRETVETADRQYIQTSTRVEMLESRRGELGEVEAKIKEIKAFISEKQRNMDEIKETVKTLEAIDIKLEDVAGKASLAREAEKLAAAKKDLEAMRCEEEQNYNELKNQLGTLETSERALLKEYNAEEHRKIEQQVRALRDSRAKALEGISRLETSMNENRRQCDSVKEGLSEKKEARKQVERLKTENHVIETLRHSLRDVVQPAIRKNNVLRVSEAFQDFYQELSNDSIDYASIDEEGNIDIVRNGEPSPVNSLSGGETTCAALAIRLAICSSLTRNQLLLLDEPTIHLDEVYRSKLRDFLGNHSFEQLIVVTHDNTFDSLPARIFRVEKRRGRSVVSSLQSGGG
ncbi:MAG: SMC family ATPase [Candidatus Bathyarchaeota archaeon]|nr:MAG: SMC family ATPase [Candidatus Bathyarchaeota archaeon]